MDFVVYTNIMLGYFGERLCNPEIMQLLEESRQEKRSIAQKRLLDVHIMEKYIPHSDLIWSEDISDCNCNNNWMHITM